MSIINLKCCLQDGQDNPGYQALSSKFDLYVNDPQENNLMESTEEISKYFNKPLEQNEIHILIKPKNS